MAWEFESTENKVKQGRLIVPSDARWNDFLEVVTAEKILKSMLLNGVFWRSLKLCFGSWHCRENIEINETKRCILTVFETMVWENSMIWKFGTAENIFEIKDAKLCLLT